MENHKKNNKFELIEVIENVAVIYQRGREKKEVFDAIYLNGDGIYTGYILKKAGNNFFEEFIECGFIPKHNIKNIEGSVKRKVYKRRI
jgi:hypothetical protein